MIKLTFPVKSYNIEDLRPLYEEFKANDPDRFAEWYRHETKDEPLGLDDLKDIQTEIYEFLKIRTQWDSQAALTSAFADFRRLIALDVRRERG